jgi:hypothetical protein
MAKTTEGAQLQHILANANVIIPVLWPNLMKPDRWLVGRAYAEVHEEGRKTSAAGLSKALLKVHGFDYVPEDLRSRVFLQTANELQNAHFAMNNFYNEPSAIGALASLGTVIPPSVFGRCMTAILCVRLGNHYGRSYSAQDRAEAMLSSLGEERWKYYLNDCLSTDEIILEKLTDSNIVKRWSDLVNQFELDKIEIANPGVTKLVRNGAKGKVEVVRGLAEGLFKHLTIK